ncbi:hypothetical protein SDC9_07762 [bioreactor metagenome]|uniref:DUF306 domain-containing protein n=1 Tax=bioreactor metagenome TaxID=1076179 RepID=A0A644T5V6_9ZZZZ|nr:META domain-containing protein [Candidatus Elulimicrobiales bacterium]
MAENKNTYGIVYLLVAAVAVAGFFFLVKKIDGFKGRNDTINSVADVNSTNGDSPLTFLLGDDGWYWISTAYADATNFNPIVEDAFKLTLKGDGTFTTTTDCNNAFGKYDADNNKISFYDIGSTKMYCQSSQEGEYLENLSNVERFSINEKGVLVFNLKDSKGEMFFSPTLLER